MTNGNSQPREPGDWVIQLAVVVWVRMRIDVALKAQLLSLLKLAVDPHAYISKDVSFGFLQLDDAA
jgi:uncharacterized membrane protein